MAASTGSRRDSASSGSSSAMRSVEWTTSARRIVTNFRSLSGSAVGCAAAPQLAHHLSPASMVAWHAKQCIPAPSSAKECRTKYPAGSCAQVYFRLWRTETCSTSRPKVALHLDVAHSRVLRLMMDFDVPALSARWNGPRSRVRAAEPDG